MLNYFYIISLTDSLSQNRLNVFTVNFNIPPTSCYILSLVILKYHQAQLFQMMSSLIQSLCHSLQEVVTYNALSVSSCIISIILWLVSRSNISIQSIYPCSQTAAALDISLVHQHHRQLRVFLRQGNGTIAASSPAASNENICLYSFYFHTIASLDNYGILLLSLIFHNLSLPMSKAVYAMYQHPGLIPLTEGLFLQTAPAS